MTFEATTFRGIVGRAFPMTFLARPDTRDKNIRSLVTFRDSGMTGDARHHAMRLVVKIRVRQPVFGDA